MAKTTKQARKNMSSTENLVNTSTNEEDEEACVYALQVSISHVLPMVLNAAIELDLFDIIARAAGPTGHAHISPSEIASKLTTQSPDAASKLDRMLHLLASHSLLTCSLRTYEDGSVERLYGLAPAGKFYVSSREGGSLAPASLLVFHRASRVVDFHSKEAILEGGSQFEKVHGMSIFQYMDKDPTLNKVFNGAMANLSTIHMKKILDAYKGFEGLKSLVDVGGGNGTCLNMTISKYPSIRGINFDLPQVIHDAPSYPGIEHVGGDMFLSIPKGDAIMIKHTCHNWSDEHCLKLFKNCYASLPEKGKVIVVDFLMPVVPESSNAAKYVSQLDNIMLLHAGGKERTEKQFEALCKGAGFSDFQLICRPLIVGVMEFYK